MSFHGKFKIGVACGGTGGHIFPGLATAYELKERGHHVALWLAGREIENNAVKGWQDEKISIPGSGFRLFLSKEFLMFLCGFVRSYISAYRIMRKSCYHAFLAMGNYASAGPVMAANTLKIPVVFHEANAIPGRALYFLAWAADIIAVSFPQTTKLFKHKHIVHTGYPLRKSLLAPRPHGMVKKAFTLLVMGGSQGASFLNETVTESVIELHKQKINFSVIHLTGKQDYEMVQTKYRNYGVNYEVYDFLNEMENAYARADFVVSRAGAGACFEILNAGIPALLVPYPYASKNHQTANAVAINEMVGFDFIEQKDLTPTKLSQYLREMILNKQKLDLIKARIKTSSNIDGTKNLADLVEQSALKQ